MLKKIDLLLFRSFIPAFAISFVIALFVLTIQFLWLWLDELVGKGISLLVIAELISYLLLAFVPMSLPIGILISSVMLFGGLSEKYELSSLKSAGVPLLRIMKPLIFLTSGIALFSFFCSNNFIPVANLKSQTRLFDIKKQKPALNIEPGVFNDVFPGFSIRVGKKDEDNQHIEDVIVYEDQTSTNGKVNIIRAKKGVMYVSEDDRFFVMDLQDGQQYQEMSPKGSVQANVPPFIRTRFKSYNKVFDLSAFAFTKSNEDLFKSNQSMLTSRQLMHAVDSIEEKIVSISVDLGADLSRNMLLKDTNRIVKQDDQVLLNPQRKDRFDSFRLKRQLAEERTVAEEKGISFKRTNAPETPFVPNEVKASRSIIAEEIVKADSASSVDQKEGKEKSVFKVLEYYPAERHFMILDQTRAEVRNIISRAQISARYLESESTVRAKHLYELHQKFSLAFICIIFLFIGAPMGAIVRKGGFGYPLLVAIIFFVFFIFLTIFCKKLTGTLTIPAILGAWMPCLIMFPIGLFLTVKAMNDSSLLQTDQWLIKINKLFRRKSKTA